MILIHLNNLNMKYAGGEPVLGPSNYRIKIPEKKGTNFLEFLFYLFLGQIGVFEQQVSAEDFAQRI